MKKITLIIIIFSTLLVGMSIGVILFSIVEIEMMKEYDLYNCIYNNADANGFTENPYVVKQIQDECICFRENNYTNLLEADC